MVNKDNLNNYNSNTIASEESTYISTANIIRGKNAGIHAFFCVTNYVRK